MKIKEWIEKHAKEVLIGVIVSVITTGIIKGLEWITEITPTAGNSLWRFFSNSFFSAAARMTQTSLITFLFSALIGVAIVYVYVLLSKALGVTKKAIVNAKDILGDIDNPKTRVSEERKKITTAAIKNEAENIIKDAKKGRIITIVGIVIFVLYFAYIFLFNLLPHGLWTDYQRDLLKIAPYIEQQDLDIIKSNWVCMQSKEDYDNIYKRIDAIKNEYDLP